MYPKTVRTFIETRPAPDGKYRATVYRQLEGADQLRRGDEEAVAIAEFFSHTAADAEALALASL